MGHFAPSSEYVFGSGHTLIASSPGSMPKICPRILTRTSLNGRRVTPRNLWISWKGKPYWIINAVRGRRLGESQPFLWYLEAIGIYSFKVTVGFLDAPFLWT